MYHYSIQIIANKNNVVMNGEKVLDLYQISYFNVGKCHFKINLILSDYPMDG